MLITVNGPLFLISRTNSRLAATIPSWLVSGIMWKIRSWTLQFSFTGNSGINITPYGWSTVFSAPNGFVVAKTITITVNDGHTLFRTAL
jgi:hypothetical protein